MYNDRRDGEDLPVLLSFCDTCAQNSCQVILFLGHRFRVTRVINHKSTHSYSFSSLPQQHCRVIMLSNHWYPLNEKYSCIQSLLSRQSKQLHGWVIPRLKLQLVSTAKPGYATTRKRLSIHRGNQPNCLLPSSYVCEVKRWNRSTGYKAVY